MILKVASQTLVGANKGDYGNYGNSSFYRRCRNKQGNEGFKKGGASGSTTVQMNTTVN